MELPHHAFEAFDWEEVPKELHTGETGESTWQVKQLGSARVRLVQYSPNYKADHWCSKGHIIYCVEGAMETLLADGRKIDFKKGMTYLVGDGDEAHQSSSQNGCTLFIVD